MGCGGKRTRLTLSRARLVGSGAKCSTSNCTKSCERDALGVYVRGVTVLRLDRSHPSHSVATKRL